MAASRAQTEATLKAYKAQWAPVVQRSGFKPFEDGDGMTHPTRPNIVFIVADDLGYADLGCYGGRDASFGPVSPCSMAWPPGLKLTQGYSNSPVCSPTRFALMTGRYQYRLRGAAEEPINSKSRGSTTLGLPPEHPTLPSLLRDAGYRTALMGKWHLGYPPRSARCVRAMTSSLAPCRAGWTTSPTAAPPASTTCT